MKMEPSTGKPARHFFTRLRQSAFAFGFGGLSLPAGRQALTVLWLAS